MAALRACIFPGRSSSKATFATWNFVPEDVSRYFVILTVAAERVNPTAVTGVGVSPASDIAPSSSAFKVRLPVPGT
jgi:hypothetical protein